jgi:hypothetical protein
MGKAYFDLKQLTTLGPNMSDVHDFWLPVHLDAGKKEAGELRIQISFYPIDCKKIKGVDDKTIDTTGKTLPDSGRKLTGEDKKLQPSNESKVLEEKSVLKLSTPAEPKVAHLPVNKEVTIEAKEPTTVAPTTQIKKAVSENQLVQIPFPEPSGVLRICLQEIDLSKEAMESEGYSEKRQPSPYLEFLDINGYVTSNEVTMLADSNSVKKKDEKSSEVPGVPSLPKKRGSKDLDTLIKSLEVSKSNENPTLNRSSFDVRLLYRTNSSKKTISAETFEEMEFFVRDIDQARIIVLCKDHEIPKTTTVLPKAEKDSTQNDASKNQEKTAVRHPILGKTELSIKSMLLRAAKQAASGDQAENDGSEWCRLFPINVQMSHVIVGRFRLTLSYFPVSVDETLLLAEEDLEVTNTGTLQIAISHAENLPAVDSSGTSDPYCKIRLNTDLIHKTKTIKKNNMKPQWNESCSMRIECRRNSRLHIEIRDWNQFEENKLLGLAGTDTLTMIN